MEQIPLKEKISYGLTEMASTLVWGTISGYLLYFYTDVFGLAAGAVGTLFLITRILDAIIDPVVGVFIDKTNTKWGKCRPYFLWMSLPVAIFMVLTFTVPDLPHASKLIYAYVTYGLLGILYSAINLPVTAILPRLAQDSKNRTSFGMFRVFLGMVGNILVGFLTLPLVNAIGAGNQAKGFQITVIIYAAIAVALFLYAFKNMKERVQINQEQKSNSVKDGIMAMRGNLPWLIMLLVGLIMQLTMSMRSSSTIYYLTYNLGRQDLVPIMSGMMLLLFLPMALTPYSVTKMGKRNTCIMGNVISLVGYLVIYPIGKSSIPLLFVGNIISVIGLGFAMSLIFIMISDTVDYGEWKNGVRAEGLLSAAASFGQKVGVGLGGALSAWILAYGQYIAGAQTQSESAIGAIAFNYTVTPIVGTIMTIALLLFYKEIPHYAEQ